MGRVVSRLDESIGPVPLTRGSRTRDQESWNIDRVKTVNILPTVFIGLGCAVCAILLTDGQTTSNGGAERAISMWPLMKCEQCFKTF